jgi:hypothetical protein
LPEMPASAAFAEAGQVAVDAKRLTGWSASKRVGRPELTTAWWWISSKIQNCV